MGWKIATFILVASIAGKYAKNRHYAVEYRRTLCNPLKLVNNNVDSWVHCVLQGASFRLAVASVDAGGGQLANTLVPLSRLQVAHCSLWASGSLPCCSAL